MNKRIKYAAALLLCLSFFLFCVMTGYAQKGNMQKVIDDALNYQNMTIEHAANSGNFPNGSPIRLVYQVKDCRIDEKEFNGFKQWNNYEFYDLDIERRYRFGFYDDCIVGFKFYQQSYENNTLEYAVKMANNNPSLTQPSFNSVKDVNDYYVKCVKKHSKIAGIGKKELSDKLLNRLTSSPERIVRYFKEYPYNAELLDGVTTWTFLKALDKYPNGLDLLCESSPYGNDVFKGVDLLSYLENRRSDKNYVFYTKQNEGYIVNKETSYTGGIRNKQMHGKGKLERVEIFKNALFSADTRRVNETWEGGFENGEWNGKMKHVWTDKYYNAGNGNRYKEASDFKFEEQGYYINGYWDGLLVLKVVYTYRYKTGGLFSSEDVFYREDCFHYHYDNGLLVSKETMKSDLTQYLMEKNASFIQFAEYRVPKIRSIKPNGNGYDITYEDGTFISRAYSINKNGEIECWGWPDSAKKLTSDEAARYAYLWRKFHNAFELCYKYGIPNWER